MVYHVVATTPDSITLWDGETMTSPEYSKHTDHEQRATVEYTMSGHDYEVGDKVMLIIRRIRPDDHPVG